MTIPYPAPSKVPLSPNNWVTLTTSPLNIARTLSLTTQSAGRWPPVHCINHAKTRSRPEHNAIHGTSQYAKSGVRRQILDWIMWVCAGILIVISSCRDSTWILRHNWFLPSPFQSMIMSLTIQCELLKWTQSLSDRDYVTHYTVWAIKMDPVPVRSLLCHSLYSVSYQNVQIYKCRSRWPRGIKRGSAAARLLRLWVRIPPRGHGCLSVVSVVCCQVEICASGWSLVQRSPTDSGASLRVI